MPVDEVVICDYFEKNIINNHELELLCLRGNHVTGATLAVTKTAKDLLLPFRTSKHVNCQF